MWYAPDDEAAVGALVLLVRDGTARGGVGVWSGRPDQAGLFPAGMIPDRLAAVVCEAERRTGVPLAVEVRGDGWVVRRWTDMR